MLQVPTYFLTISLELYFFITYLFQGMPRQVVLNHIEVVLLHGEDPHGSVGLPVMEGHRGQVVKVLAQVVLGLKRE